MYVPACLLVLLVEQSQVHSRTGSFDSHMDMEEKSVATIDIREEDEDGLEDDDSFSSKVEISMMEIYNEQVSPAHDACAMSESAILWTADIGTLAGAMYRRRI